MNIRPLVATEQNQTDIDKIEALENAEQDFPWSRKIIESCFGPRYLNFGIFENDNLLGYLVSDCIAGEANLMNICIAKSHRRQGLAEKLLTEMFSQIQAKNADTVWLEVRESNLAAINLYEKLGFNQISIRPKYYPTKEGGNEDAVIMSLMLFS